MNEYISYETLKTELGISGTGDDALLKRQSERASRGFDGATHRRFYPRVETRYYDHPEDDRVLTLDEDLLEVITLTTQNGNEAVAAADYFLMCGLARNVTPYNRVELRRDGKRPNFLYSGTPQRANSIEGIWGYHEDWGNAWQDSNDSVQDAGGINASATSITVSDADGADAYGLTPRFRVQQLLKVGDEYLYLTAKDSEQNTLTVRRGVNGTTAASHDMGTTIYVYVPMWDIEQAVLRWAMWLYRLRDAPFEKTGFIQLGVVTVPSALPPDIREVVKRYRR